VFAHPDDESFLAGPLIAYCTAHGATVELVVATPPPALPGDAYNRRQELARAAEILGIRRVHYLGYDATPMLAPSPPADSLAAAPLEDVAYEVQTVIGDFQPHAVVTDSVYGAYGHPDHIIVHRAAVAALGGMSDEGDVPALYALAYPLPLVRAWLRMLRLWRVDITRLCGRDDLNLTSLVAGAPPPSIRLNVARYMAHRSAAAQCHVSQLVRAPLPMRLVASLPAWANWSVLGQTWLTRIATDANEDEFFAPATQPRMAEPTSGQLRR
jgi:N-acetyl-1-D-myo-inositol-2-amino-2-deoxy-alpha-D-glucopyranoside deacetylase